MATDFTTSYAQSVEALVSLAADVGTGTAESSGFITQVHGTKYIVTAAHAVLRDRSVWGMEQVLFSAAGSQDCDTWKASGQLALPAGVKTITFRYVGANDASKGVFLDNVSLRGAQGVIFRDGFSGSDTFGSQWSVEDAPWTIAKYKGRALSCAARSGVTTDLSTLRLNISTTETTTLKFDYRLECDGGSFIVGYCTKEKCERLSSSIQGYYGQRVHQLRVVGLDGKGDIAILLPADGSDLSAFPALRILADNKAIPIASPVAVIGNPLGIDSCSIATGVLRDNNYVLPTAQVVESVLTSVADFSGNSGSPYLLLDGSVVGLNTYGLSSDAGGESTLNGGPGAAILSRVLSVLASQVSEDQVVEYQKAYLGVQLVGVDLNVINQLELPMKGADPTTVPGGFVVTVIEPDSPLSAHLQALDVLLYLAQSEMPETLRRVGVFPGQTNPSEVTWYMPATGSVDLGFLRFDLSQGIWVKNVLTNLPLTPYPRGKDVPLGPTTSHKSALLPQVSLLHRRVDGKVTRRLYGISQVI